MSVKLIDNPDKVSRRTIVLVRWEIQKFRLTWPQSHLTYLLRFQPFLQRSGYIWKWN